MNPGPCSYRNGKFKDQNFLCVFPKEAIYCRIYYTKQQRAVDGPFTFYVPPTPKQFDPKAVKKQK